jgi:serine/threonine protein phosphatase PrpC
VVSPQSSLSIQCANPNCGVPNPQTERHCHQCGAVVPRILVRAFNLDWSHMRVGDLVGDRYAYWGHNLLLDTRPGEAPEVPNEVPALAVPYLRLLGYRPHIPQPYGILRYASDQGSALLFEGLPVEPETGRPFPSFLASWGSASPLRQLNWLWQLANLWKPCADLGVASSLLDFELIHTEGSWVRLMALQVDDGPKGPRLGDLGRAWKGLVPHPAIADYFNHLLEQLILHRISNAAGLLHSLEQALEALVQPEPAIPVAIAACTDPGPSRERNEDGCYPASGADQQAAPIPRHASFAIVCDGLGGHESGEVASDLAIAILSDRLTTFLDRLGSNIPLLSRTEQVLGRALLDANAAIAERNDREAREERHRMGTTAVTALQLGRHLFIAHVGDSRIYRLSRSGCHQVTLDDDLASRETRLGYAFYRDVCRQPSAGALVQALGMASSDYLAPALRRFFLDEDCIFLLCSDGISDFELVERFWPDLALPVLDGHQTVLDAARRAVALANQHNGHDNATIALIYARAGDALAQTPPLAPVVTAAIAPADTAPAATEPNPTAPPKTKIPGPPAPAAAPAKANASPPSDPTAAPANPGLWLLTLAIVLLGGGTLAVWLRPRLTAFLPSSSPTPSPTVTAPTPEPIAPSPIPLAVGNILEATDPNPLAVHPQPNLDRPATGTLVAGTLLAVEAIATPNGTRWIQVRICRTPALPNVAPPTAPNRPEIGAKPPLIAPSPSPNPLPAGAVGWLQDSALTPAVMPATSATAIATCQPPSP